MSNIEFLKFDMTPGEKHVGIATVRYEKRFIFRFKIIPKEVGGYYCQPASHKIGSYAGKDTYAPSFALDSSYEADEMRSFILSQVEPLIANAQQGSVFGLQPINPVSTYQSQGQAKQMQPAPNYAGFQNTAIQTQQYRQDTPIQHTHFSPPTEENMPF